MGTFCNPGKLDSPDKIYQTETWRRKKSHLNFNKSPGATWISSPCSPVRTEEAVFLMQLVQKKGKRQGGKTNFLVRGSSTSFPSPLHFSGQTGSAWNKGLSFGLDPLLPFYSVCFPFPLCSSFYSLSPSFFCN